MKQLQYGGGKGVATMDAADRIASVAPVDFATEGPGRGARIKARREHIGWTARRLAERAGIGRDTLARVEADDEGVQALTYAKVEKALDDLAEELGFEEADRGGRLIRYEIRDPHTGMTAMIVSAPVEDLPQLQASVADILRTLGYTTGGGAAPGDGDTP